MTSERLTSFMQRAMGDGRQEFGSFFLSRFYGMTIDYEDAACMVTFEVQPEMFNPQGSLHGGVLATALDISMGHLLQKHKGAGVTLEMKVQYFAPVRTGLVRCRGTFLKEGRKISFLQSTAVDSESQTLAHATATWKTL